MRTRTVLLLVAGAGALAATTAVATGQLSGTPPARSAQRTIKVTRGNVVATVGGLGRIVTAGPGQVTLPAASGAKGAAAGPGAAGAAASSTAPSGAVFPATSGRIEHILVAAGQQVRAGQVVAVLNDGGTAATALVQARDDLASARIDLAQKRVSDPARGLPATQAELNAAELAVTAARAKLALLDHPTVADMSAAGYEIQKAKGDYATLTQRPTHAAVAAARLAVGLALERLSQATPAANLDVSAALADLAKARAELDALTPAPPQPAMDAASLAVALAKQRIAELQPSASQSEVIAAQLELSKSQADLAALVQGGRPAAIVAAQAAADSATQKLLHVTGPATRVVVETARLELEKAKADLAVLRRPAPPAARAAGRLAIDLARRKLRALLRPAPSLRYAAEADVAKALADLDVLRHRGGPAAPSDIASAQIKVAAAASRVRLAATQARHLTVRASTGGTVTAVLASAGTPADPTTPIVTVADLLHLEVSVDLSEFDAARVRRGQHASVAVDALGGTRLPGTVRFEALAGVDNGGVVTFPVRIRLGRLDGVKPGMNASVRIVVEQRRNVVAVPLEVVSGGSVTVLSASGKTTKRHVVLGLASNKDVEIRRGLRAGETVVPAGASGV